MITEQEKMNMLGVVSNAIDLYDAFTVLHQSLEDTQFILEFSVSEGYWRVMVLRQDREDVEGCGWSIEEAIIATLPYLND